MNTQKLFKIHFKGESQVSFDVRWSQSCPQQSKDNYHSIWKGNRGDSSFGITRSIIFIINNRTHQEPIIFALEWVQDAENNKRTHLEPILDDLELLVDPRTASPIFLINSFVESLLCSIWWRTSNHQTECSIFTSPYASQTFETWKNNIIQSVVNQETKQIRSTTMIASGNTGNKSLTS